MVYHREVERYNFQGKTQPSYIVTEEFIGTLDFAGARDFDFKLTKKQGMPQS